MFPAEIQILKNKKIKTIKDPVSIFKKVLFTYKIIKKIITPKKKGTWPNKEILIDNPFENSTLFH